MQVRVSNLPGARAGALGGAGGAGTDPVGLLIPRAGGVGGGSLRTHAARCAVAAAQELTEQANPPGELGLPLPTVHQSATVNLVGAGDEVAARWRHDAARFEHMSDPESPRVHVTTRCRASRPRRQGPDTYSTGSRLGRTGSRAWCCTWPTAGRPGRRS